jgi:hypothetical protein
MIELLSFSNIYWHLFAEHLPSAVRVRSNADTPTVRGIRTYIHSIVRHIMVLQNPSLNPATITVNAINYIWYNTLLQRNGLVM